MLIVDDEALIRWSVGTTLAEAGYTVLGAASGAEAREQAAAHEIDFALLDVRLPDTDGVALMKEIQRVHPSCRFLFMTAFRTPELVHSIEGEDVPIVDKPFSLPDLVRTVDARLHEPPHLGPRYTD